MHRSRRFGHGVVVSKICYVQYSDCVQDLDYRILIVLSVVTSDWCKPMNHCRDWAFSHSGLEAGLPAFQLPMLAKRDTAEKRFVRHVCFRNPCLLNVKSKPPLPSRSLRSLRAAVRSTSSALWLDHAHLFVAAEEKRPVSCREAEGLVTALWSPRSVTIIYWLCSYVTAAN